MELKGLNILRLILFVSIFTIHFLGFFLGVELVCLFFTLSSFLITFQMLRELNETNKFSVKNFFFRRSLRIFPLYFFILSILLIALPICDELFDLDIQFPDKPYFYWFFIGNLEKSDHLFALKFLWTISVEEQFYLLFICISPLFKRFFLLSIKLLLLVYLIFNIVLLFFSFSTYELMFSYIPFFISGMLCAFYYRELIEMSLKRHFLYGSIFIVFSIFFYFTEVTSFYYFSLAFFYCFFLIVYIKVASKYAHTLLWLERGGKLAYGLYVYSGIVLTVESVLFGLQKSFLLYISELVVIYITALISYKYLEKPFLNLKNRFRSLL